MSANIWTVATVAVLASFQIRCAKAVGREGEIVIARLAEKVEARLASEDLRVKISRAERSDELTIRAAAAKCLQEPSSDIVRAIKEGLEAGVEESKKSGARSASVIRAAANKALPPFGDASAEKVVCTIEELTGIK